MILLSCQVAVDLADALEQHFCELDRSPWMLMRQEGTEHFKLNGYFESAPQAEADWRQLRSCFSALPENAGRSELEEESWINRYRESFKPWSCRGLHWIPLWMKDSYEVPIAEAAVYIDPGLAFGTGDHPTTRLCAYRLLDFRDSRGGRMEGCSVIDAGTGSGILALSAARMGFLSVFGFDVDPVAVRVCGENQNLNLLGERVECRRGGLGESLRGRKADLILANIESDILCRYSAELLRSLKPGGVLALSGIFGQEIELVSRDFSESAERLGVRCAQDRRQEGDWWDLGIFAAGSPSEKV